MKFSIDRDALLEPIQMVSSVVEKRQTQPVLSNLLCVYKEGRVTFTGTDQEVELSASTEAAVGGESGEVTVPARKLVDICRSLPVNAVIQLGLGVNRINISSGRFNSYLSTLPATDFPKVDMAETSIKFVMQAVQLGDLLHKTSFAMAQQDVRYFFNGMLIEIEEGLVRSVATNGQRLAISEVEMKTGLTGKSQFIVPRKGVIELSRLIKEAGAAEVELQLSSNHLRATSGSACLTSKLIDGTYPDYDKAIPDIGDKLVRFDRLELREALRRIAILSNEMYRSVRFQLSNGKIQLHANNPQQDEAEETVNVDYEGKELIIGFNVSYLIDVLTILEGKRVTCSLSDSDGAALLTDPEEQSSRFVVSAMKL